MTAPNRNYSGYLAPATLEQHIHAQIKAALSTIFLDPRLCGYKGPLGTTIIDFDAGRKTDKKQR